MLDPELLGEEILRVSLRNPRRLLEFALLLAPFSESGCHSSSRNTAAAANAPPVAARAGRMPASQVIDFVPQKASAKSKLVGTTLSVVGSTHSGSLVKLPFPGESGELVMLSHDVNAPVFERPWLGVGMDWTPDDQPGVLVTRVVPDSPAANAGIQKGDALLLIDDEPVNESSQVSHLVQSKRVGTDTVVSVARNGKFLRFTLHLKPIPTPGELLRQKFVGKPAPGFFGVIDTSREVLRGQHSAELGSPAHLLDPSKDLRGKPLVLIFWRPDCRECPLVVPYVNRWSSRYAGRVTVRGVAALEPAEVEREAKKFAIHYPTFADPHGATTVAYGATLAPTLFLIDAAGIVRDALIGSETTELDRMQRAIEAVAK